VQYELKVDRLADKPMMLVNDLAKNWPTLVRYWWIRLYYESL